MTPEEKKVVETTRLKIKSKELRLTPLSPSNLVGVKLIAIIDKQEQEINELKKPENRGIGDGDIIALFKERDELRQKLAVKTVFANEAKHWHDEAVKAIADRDEWKRKQEIDWEQCEDARDLYIQKSKECDELKKELDEAWAATKTPVRGMVSLAEFITELKWSLKAERDTLGMAMNDIKLLQEAIKKCTVILREALNEKVKAVASLEEQLKEES